MADRDLTRPAFRYSSAGRRPERLNQSRDVNVPVQLARGWAAGLLGLPGDVEGLVRMLPGIKDETPVLPTSDFYREYLPGYDERAAARAMSGLGALAGGAGATNVVRGGLGAVKRATDPEAIRQYVRQTQGLTGMPGTAVVKPKGGNWRAGAGSPEEAVRPLRTTIVGMEPAERVPVVEDVIRQYEAAGEGAAPFVERMRADKQRLAREGALNNWIDQKLAKYIRNEMGTPEDPVRALAERGVLHFEPEARFAESAWVAPDVPQTRQRAGFPEGGLGESDLARRWEAISDAAIYSEPAQYMLAGAPEEVLAANPWLAKVPPETPVHVAASPGTIRNENLNFSHLIDELRNATNPNSDLPANLRWKPEDLDKVTMAQAVERVSKINEYRAAQKAEANEVLARNPATAPHKDYQTVPGTDKPNEKGLAWKQIKMPEAALPEGYSARHLPEVDMWGIYDPQGGAVGMGATEREAMGLFRRDERKKSLEDALKYEGEVMGHCVGGYCDDVLSGRSQIFSLRDKKGEPHVTIEVRPATARSDPEEMQAIYDKVQAEADARNFATLDEQDRFYFPRVKELQMQMLAEKAKALPPEIIQIKGKANRAPKEEYLPFVQDFVRSGNWSSVGDLKNAGLVDAGEDAAQSLGRRFLTEQEWLEYDRASRAPAGGRGAGFATGGLVSAYDPARISALADEILASAA